MNAYLFLFLFLFAVTGFATGAITGLFTSLVLKLGAEGVVKDGLLGVLGFFVGLVGCTVLFPRGELDSFAVAIILAAVLALLHEVYRRYAPSKLKSIH